MYSYVHIQICIPLLLKTHKGYGTEVWSGEKIAFNYGREIFVYPYKGVKKAADLTKPIDKRIYKVMLQRLNIQTSECGARLGDGLCQFQTKSFMQ